MTAAAGQIEGVLFDADGVLQRARPGWRARLEDIGGPGFAEMIMEAEHGPLIGAEPFADAVRRVLVARGLDPDPLPVLRVWEDVDLDPAALALVTRLRANGTPCHLASNQQDVRVRYMRDALGYGDLLDELFFSAELGLVKPDPAFFTAIGERLGVAPGRLLFIDDVEDNAAGARLAGLRAARHDPASGAAGLEQLLQANGLLLDDA